MRIASANWTLGKKLMKVIHAQEQGRKGQERKPGKQASERPADNGKKRLCNDEI